MQRFQAVTTISARAVILRLAQDDSQCEFIGVPFRETSRKSWFALVAQAAGKDLPASAQLDRVASGKCGSRNKSYPLMI